MKTTFIKLSTMRKLVNSCLLTLLFLLPVSIASANQAQKKDVVVLKGIVTDNVNEPLAGASVIIKGSTKGSFTDVDGKFSIEIDKTKKNVVLVFSFIGMDDKEIKWNGETKMTVVLESSKIGLDDVVITGFREIDKRKLSSSITSVKMDNIKQAAASSLDQMLQGSVAGMSVIGASSTPGVAPKIRIRGSSSITGSRDPIWVVDGIILDEPVNVSTEDLNNIDNVNYIGNAISGLNPNDIERIDILKDVSATALYGTKAANGVIVVTTKKGENGRVSVNYNGTVSVTTAPRYSQMNLMNSKERVEMSEEIVERGLKFSSFAPKNVAYEGLLEDLWMNRINRDEFRYKVRDLKNLNTDWAGLLFRPATTQQHNLSVSGGTTKMNYYVSLGRLDQKDVHRYGGMSRTTAMIKVYANLGERVKVGFKVNTGFTKQKYTHSSVSLLNYVYNTSRAISPYDENNDLYFYPKSSQAYGSKLLGFNIFNELKNTGKEIGRQNFTVNANLDWQIMPWVTFSTIAGVASNTTSEEEWADEQSFYISKKRGSAYGEKLYNNPKFQVESKLPIGGELKTGKTKNLRYNLRSSFNFNKTFKRKHDIFAIVGMEIASSTYKGYARTDYGYLPFRGKSFANIDSKTYVAYNNLISGLSPKITDELYNSLSMYGAFTYTYDNRYIANFNIRADGSNRFGQDKSVRFLPVYSISGRWNAHREKFLRKVSWLNELAVRASFGLQGNVHPSQTPYLILSHGAFNSNLGEYTSTLSQYPNTRLKWEKTLSYNLGIDWAVLDGRLSGSIEGYHKVGYDQIITRRIAPSSGAASLQMNAGNIYNSGWELSINVVPIRTKDWLWSLSFNSGKNYNKVTNKGEITPTFGDFIDGSIVRDGMSVNSFYSYRFKGLNHETGLPEFYGMDVTEKDKNGNLIQKFTTKEDFYNNIFDYSGKREPDLSGGFSSSLKYKNFTFNALFSFAFGGKTRLNDLYHSSGQTLPYPEQNMNREYLERWQKPGDEKFTNIPVLSNNIGRITLEERPLINEEYLTYANDKWDMYNKSDIRVVSSSFLRCRSMSLRYDFDQKLLKKTKIFSNASIAIEASNVFIIKDKRLKGQDPEQLPLYSGTIPPQRTYSLRLNLSF